MDAEEIRELVALADSPIKEGSGWFAYCPTHPDGQKHNRSGPGRQGRSLHIGPKGIKCFAERPECTGAAILRALRAESPKAARKAPNPRKASRSAKPTLVKAYEYRDPETDVLLAVKSRWEWPEPTLAKGRDKTFRWRKPDSEKWSGGVDLTDMPLWGAPAVAVADPDQPVWWVEGEECVSRLEAAGELAVCDPRGSSGKAWLHGQLDCLTNRDVIVWADNDSPGRTHARAVRDALREVARRVVVWEPPRMPESGDVADFLAAGRDLSEFKWPDADVLSPYEVSPDGTVSAHRHTKFGNVMFTARSIHRGRSVQAVVEIAAGRLIMAYSQINVQRDEDRGRLARSAHENFGPQLADSYDLAELKRDMDRWCYGLWEASLTSIAIGPTAGADIDLEIPFVLRPYILSEGGTLAFGPPGKGKTWVTLLWAVSIDAGVDRLWPIDEQVPVLFLNLERSELRFQQRLRRVNMALGLAPARPLHAIHARGRPLNSIIEICADYVRQHGIGVIMLDSLSRAGMGKLGDDDVANRIIDALTSICPTWVAIGHSPRGDETHEFGSVMFRAGVDIEVRVTSERRDQTLGIGLEMIKSNDTAAKSQDVLSLTFDDFGLAGVRQARGGEYEEVESQASRPLREQVHRLLREEPMTVAELAEATSHSYETVRKALTRNTQMFVKVPKTRPQRWTMAVKPDEQCARCGAPIVGVDNQGRFVCQDHMD